MKILIDINHPKNVHIFKHLAKNLEDKGHKVFFTCLDKELTLQLLNAYNLEYINIAKHRKTFLGKLFNLIFYTFKLILILLKEKPTICLSQGSVYLAIAAYLTRKPHISLHDTENANFNNLFSINLSTYIITSESYEKEIKRNHIQFKGFLENAYLHPNYIDQKKHSDKDYIFIRFVAWGSTHDVGHQGISDKNKLLVVKSFLKYGKVVISSEIELPPELEKYKIKIKPEEIHSFLARAKLFYGESATMATESALLGVPSIYLDNEGRGYTRKLEKKFGLVYNFTESSADQTKSIKKGIDILSTNNSSYYKNLKDNFFKQSIDLTMFLEWIILNYPKSISDIETNPLIQNNFK